MSAGFFSEYNNMILAMLYCLDHGIRFELFSQDANFGFRKGWSDFFVPFTSESNLRFHAKYNCRSALAFEQLPAPRKQRSVHLFKLLTRTRFLTHELFELVRADAKSSRHYEIPELGINGDVKHAAKKLIDITWRFNRETGAQVDSAINELQLPQRFVGLHIRSGDKPTETKPHDITDYMQLAEKATKSRNAFVATDDYTNIELLRTAYPEWRFFHLCKRESRGYHQAAFDALPGTQKRPELLELFASVELLSRADAFVGTFTSNVGMYVGIRRERLSFGVDSSEWFVW